MTYALTSFINRALRWCSDSYFTHVTSVIDIIITFTEPLWCYIWHCSLPPLFNPPPPTAPLGSLQARQESVYTASYLAHPPPSSPFLPPPLLAVGRSGLPLLSLLPCSGPSVCQQSAQSAERSATLNIPPVTQRISAPSLDFRADRSG